MESIREISAFLLEPHFHAQAAAKRCRRARLEQRSRSGAEGASCRRRAPSEMHERRHASKSHPLATAVMLKPGQGVLWLQIPAVTQLHPKKKKKKKAGAACSAATPAAADVRHFPCTSAQAGAQLLAG